MCIEAKINSSLWLLTDIPNCSRAMRITSSVLSALLTASVLACREKFGRRYWSSVGLFVTLNIQNESADGQKDAAMFVSF